MFCLSEESLANHVGERKTREELKKEEEEGDLPPTPVFEK
jgi:hypothetical protein